MFRMSKKSSTMLCHSGLLEKLEQIKNIEHKIPDITNLTTKTTFRAKINKAEVEILSITNLATKNALNAVGNKIPSVSNLVTETDYN